MAYVRTVKTASGATVVQIVWSSRRGSRRIEHVGSAHDDEQLAALKAAAAQRVSAGQTEMDLGLAPATGSGPLPIVSSRMSHLVDALGAAYEELGLRSAAKSDNVFRDLVLARIIEPTSKIDSLRVLGEVGVTPASYATVKRRLPTYATPSWRRALSAACAAHAGLRPASLVLYDVSTLYFVINAFKAAHQLIDVTVVADAGMISEANQVAIQAAGLRSSWTPGSHFCPAWSASGATAIQARRSPMGTSSRSRGRPPAARRPAGSLIGRFTISSVTTGPAERCAAATSKSPKPNAPLMARPR